ncbi:MAG TPA: RodZ domain-containing protein [Thermodesulfovibrionales bacterium]|nr:RodZ domain-containing protein [Thermodesulfovibrionales bacterium]
MIGEILKKKREASGIDLREISDTLRIRFEYLKALEENAFNRLPEAVYTRGYIRAYAKSLGLDPEPIVEMYAKQFRQDVLIQPEPSMPEKKATLLRPLLIVSALVMVGLIIALFFRKPETPQREVRIPEVPNVPSVPEEVKMPEKTVPSPAEGERSFQPEPPYVLSVTATETTWLRVEVDDGKSEEALLKPGDSREWTSQKGFTMKVGNAGGIRASLNNKDLGPLGGKGEVLRIRLPKEEPPSSAVGR